MTMLVMFEQFFLGGFFHGFINQYGERTRKGISYWFFSRIEI